MAHRDWRIINFNQLSIHLFRKLWCNMRWWHFYSEKIMGRGNIKNVLLETAKIQKQQLQRSCKRATKLQCLYKKNFQLIYGYQLNCYRGQGWGGNGRKMALPLTLFNVFIFNNKYLFIFQIEIEHVARTNIFDTQREEYIRPICLLLMLCKGYFTKKNHKETKYMLHALVTSTVILPCMTRTKPNQFQ